MDLRRCAYGTTCNIRGSLAWGGKRYSPLFQAGVVRRTYMDLTHRRLASKVTYICFWWRRTSALIYACTTFRLSFPWGIPQLQSDWSLSCDHGLDFAS